MRKSTTEIRIGARYSIRRLGNTSWTDVRTLAAARREQRLANRVCCPGHVIVDTRSGTVVG